MNVKQVSDFTLHFYEIHRIDITCLHRLKLQKNSRDNGHSYLSLLLNIFFSFDITAFVFNVVKLEEAVNIRAPGPNQFSWRHYTLHVYIYLSIYIYTAKLKYIWPSVGWWTRMCTKVSISLCISNEIRRFDITACVFKGLKLQEAVMITASVSIPYLST